MATYYWVSRGTGFSTSWLDAQNWAATSGGTRGAGVPTASDDAVVDGNSFAITTNPTVSVQVGSVCNDFTINGVGIAMTLSNANTLTLSGSLFIQSTNVTSTGSGTFTFIGSGTHTVAFNGFATNSILFQGTGTYTLNSAITSSSGFFVFTSGTLNLNGYNVSCGIFQCNGSTTRVLNFSTSQVSCSANNTSIVIFTATNLTVTGTPTINCNYSGSTGTRQITCATLSESQSLNINITAGSDTVTLSGTQKNLNFTGFSGTYANAARTIYGNLTLASGMTLGAGTNAITFAATSGTQNITSNGKTMDFPLVFNGIGGTFAFQDAFTQGSTRTVTLTNGSLKFKNSVTHNVGTISVASTNLKSITSTTDGSQFTVNALNTTPIYARNLTVKDSKATPAGIWNAFTGTGSSAAGRVSSGCVNAGNNQGWNFIPTGSAFISFF
jgi:hypothetical protein